MAALPVRAPLLRSTDGGITWSVQTSGTSNFLSSVCFTAPNAGYAVGDSGTIIKTAKNNATGIIDNFFGQEKPLKIYPNPSFNKVTVEISQMPATGFLSVLNLNGVELIRQQISASKTMVDVGSLPDGVYLVKFTNERTVQVGKLIKH